MKLFYKAIVLLTLLFFGSSSLWAQGTVKGVISDSLTNKPLFGANVIMLGTGLGSATDFEGEYKISGIEPGKYTLKISYIGYRAVQFQVDVVDKRTLQMDVTLVPDIIEGMTVVVSAQAMGQVAAINQQLSANTIINVVSEEKIQELPDANAAEAVGRLPGVSLLRSGGEASKIILRGLSDKYTNVTIDGVTVPSTDALERGVDLSAISQGTLAGIELYKALTPDKDADAIAGSVNLITRKAPSKREIRTVFKGGYNDLMGSAKQYDFSLKYGERFFDDLLGVQLTGNLENKIRSNETIDISYDQAVDNQTDYYINNFTLNFTDEIRKRNGLSLLLDFNTPDDGNIKFSNMYYSTKRDYLLSSRDYPNGGGNTQYGGGVTYSYRDREQEIKTFNSSLTGENNLFDFELTWGLSFAQSNSDFPYDYQLDFSEASNKEVSGMRAPPQIKSDPDRLIPYAYNNFKAATLSGAYYRTQENTDEDKTAFLNLLKKYSFGKQITGEVKVGGKYKTKNRTNKNTEKFAPYYLGFWQPYEKLPDGTMREKDLSGTLFDAFFQRYLENNLNNSVSFSEFLHSDPKARDIFGEYNLNPLIDRDKLREWYEINQYGINKAGHVQEYFDDLSVDAFTYDITESVTSTYLMNTLNYGESITFLAGVRVEKENNDYKNKYSKKRFSGFPVPIATTRDTTASYSQSIVLPNFQLNIKATEFLNFRLAAYKALARPDFNMRLNTVFAWRPSGVVGTKQMFFGNPYLKTAQAWNFEINTSFFGNEIGLISLSAFYKEIKDMYHMLNGISTIGNPLIEEIGSTAKTLWDGTYNLTIPYNSPKPSKVWGFEFEHQINFTFLPGLLKNIVLSYNASLVKSETYLIGSAIDTTYTEIPGFPPVANYSSRPVERKQQLENQPEFYGNISLGYDISGFSFRISMFHQSEYNLTFSPSGRSDRIQGEFTRFDIAIKQKVTDYLSVNLNVNNLTNIKEGNYLNNRVNGYRLLRINERYGLTGDLGVRVDL